MILEQAKLNFVTDQEKRRRLMMDDRDSPADEGATGAAAEPKNTAPAPGLAEVTWPTR